LPDHFGAGNREKHRTSGFHSLYGYPKVFHFVVS